MAKSSKVSGHFSDVSGTHTRHIYDASGAHLGVIVKLESGGYKAIRTADGKVRSKEKLADAFRTIARKN